MKLLWLIELGMFWCVGGVEVLCVDFWFVVVMYKLLCEMIDDGWFW